MWSYIAGQVLRNRMNFIIAVVILTVFMGYKSRDVELDYHYATLLPKTDSAYINLMKFKEKFGEDANVMIISVTDSNFFQKNKFNDWLKLQKDLKQITGLENVFSVSEVINLKKSGKHKKFIVEKIFPDSVKSQKELDSLVNKMYDLPFYENLVYFKKHNTFLLALTLDINIVNSLKREIIIENIEAKINEWSKKYKSEIRFSGLPFTRTKIALIIKKELNMFIWLALLITAVILYIFFRSFKVVFFAILIVGTGVIWVLGSLAVFDYKITILTGMIPPLIIVIGIPNSVFLLNKYHKEFTEHGNKIKALHRVISRVGNATFLTNLTTAAGFAAFIATGNKLLMEFGVIVSLNIIGVFILSIILIPGFFSFLPAPKPKHTKHLDYKLVNKLVNIFVFIVETKRIFIYTAVVIFLFAAGYGISKVRTQGYIVDDIPEDNPIYIDLKFLEKVTGGVMPIEIVISKKDNKDSVDYYMLEKINRLQERLEKYESLSKPVSIVNAFKFVNQAFYKGKKKFYKFPNLQQANNIKLYMNNFTGNNNLINQFIDSSFQTVRISLRAKDIGTKKMNRLRKNLENELSEIFPSGKFNGMVTGSSIVFTRGTSHLINNLFTSLAIAVVIISILMASMFSSVRMIIVSIVPNILPMIFTAALMGYFEIPVKPSTVLVFSIAFGISVDNAIHFLTKYRQELISTNWQIKTSVINALRETGVSIVYTATILFYGFGIFILSDFGGTVALGTLVSVTLLFAMLSNLVLLPALLLSYEKRITTKAFKDYIIKPTSNKEKPIL